jgi:hypothetical protein
MKPMASVERGQIDDEAAYAAIEALYHAYLTGLILMLVTRAGADKAAEVVFRTFRRQQLARFVPGLRKLGIDNLPHAVACAQYHYLSNFIGGVKVEYVYESDRKAWVRYPPPRWIWWGTAVCAIPSEVSRAMLRGWHANNGVMLGNPRLGFVCTGQTVDGQPGLEGYYYEYDRELTRDERLRFSPGEKCPSFDPARAPTLATDRWPQVRLMRAMRNYAMEYIASRSPSASLPRPHRSREERARGRCSKKRSRAFFGSPLLSDAAVGRAFELRFHIRAAYTRLIFWL